MRKVPVTSFKRKTVSGSRVASGKGENGPGVAVQISFRRLGRSDGGDELGGVEADGGWSANAGLLRDDECFSRPLRRSWLRSRRSCSCQFDNDLWKQIWWVASRPPTAGRQEELSSSVSCDGGLRPGPAAEERGICGPAAYLLSDSLHARQGGGRRTIWATDRHTEGAAIRALASTCRGKRSALSLGYDDRNQVFGTEDRAALTSSSRGLNCLEDVSG